MLIFGFGRKTIKDFGSVGEKTCQRCNNHVDMHKLKIIYWFTIYFIPLIPYKVKYIIACPICKDTQDISKSEFLEEEVKINQYAGKTETQIAYLKQMEEYNNNK